VWPAYYRFYGGFGISPILGGILVVNPLALVVTLPLGLLVGLLLLDRLSAINGFTLLLPIYFIFPAGNIAAAALAVALAAIYWYAKGTRLTRWSVTDPSSPVDPEPRGVQPEVQAEADKRIRP
jgi:glycerol-3-phosphate acyltransferase PlsY